MYLPAKCIYYVSDGSRGGNRGHFSRETQGRDRPDPQILGGLPVHAPGLGGQVDEQGLGPHLLQHLLGEHRLRRGVEDQVKVPYPARQFLGIKGCKALCLGIPQALFPADGHGHAARAHRPEKGRQGLADVPPAHHQGVAAPDRAHPPGHGEAQGVFRRDAPVFFQKSRFPAIFRHPEAQLVGPGAQLRPRLGRDEDRPRRREIFPLPPGGLGQKLGPVPVGLEELAEDALPPVPLQRREAHCVVQQAITSFAPVYERNLPGVPKTLCNRGGMWYDKGVYPCTKAFFPGRRGPLPRGPVIFTI